MGFVLIPLFFVALIIYVAIPLLAEKGPQEAPHTAPISKRTLSRTSKAKR
jgi:hypothetical protein